MSNGAQWGCRAESTVRAEMAGREMVLAGFLVWHLHGNKQETQYNHRGTTLRF